MKRRFYKTIAVLSVLVGIALVAFEGSRLARGTGGAESWFWLALGVGVLVLGAVELLQKPVPPGDE